MNAVGRAFQKAKRLFASREKFLVLELAPGGRTVDASFLSVDEERNLAVGKSARGVDPKKFLRSRGGYGLGPRRKMVVAADSSLATTMPVPLELVRDRARAGSEIALDEIENLIAQAMQKIFTQCRSEASKRLATADIHAILVGAVAGHFRIDGRAVMNPIGFAGKKISLLLELTFTNRDVFDAFRERFNSPETFFFIEAPQAWMRGIGRLRRLPIAVVSPSTTLPDKVVLGSSLFIFQNQNSSAGGGYPILFREKLEWSFDAVHDAIAATLGVSDAVAKDLYRVYRAGSLSPAAARSFKKMIQPAVDALLRELEQANIKGFVYMNLPHEHKMPFDLPYKHAHKRGGMTFEAMPVNEILTELGLQADGAESAEGNSVPFRHLAPFLESYFSKSSSEINQKLRRRLHWLAE